MLYLNIDTEKEVNKYPLNERPVLVTVEGVNIPRYSYNMIDMPKVQQSLQNGEYTFTALINAVMNEYYSTARDSFIYQMQQQGVANEKQLELLGKCLAKFRETSGGSGDMCNDYAVFRAAQIHNGELAALMCKGIISGINDIYCLSGDKSTLYYLDDGKDYDLYIFRSDYDIKEFSRQNIDITTCMFDELKYQFEELRVFNTFAEMAQEVPLNCLEAYIQEALWGYVSEDNPNTTIKVAPTAEQYLRCGDNSGGEGL